MATAGLDSMMKIWDLRMFKCLHSYKTDHPAMSLDISDRNLIALAVGRSVHVLQDAFTKPTDLTYLKHTIRTPNSSLSSGGGVSASTKFLASSISTGSVKFRPYEDVLAIGHTHGLSTIIVPGTDITLISYFQFLIFFSN
jgi:U3 small nucleolar RNA-associated protein 7